MTPHFKDKELCCKCGCGMLPQLDFIEKIERLRIIFGKSLRVTSAARCPDYNARVSSTGRTGPHTTGRAIDIAVDRKTAFDLLELSFQFGFTGIGVQQKGGGRFLHLDDLPNTPTNPRPTIWSY